MHVGKGNCVFPCQKVVSCIRYYLLSDLFTETAVSRQWAWKRILRSFGFLVCFVLRNAWGMVAAGTWNQWWIEKFVDKYICCIVYFPCTKSHAGEECMWVSERENNVYTCTCVYRCSSEYNNMYICMLILRAFTCTRENICIRCLRVLIQLSRQLITV